ncbi:secreted antigen 1 [Babesia caballi]|uniref:Secreted antigen 1 n=1 Tax=Babesia caballi TaxID=5871 RepID=A0AAV4LLF1_BABCB|nr:secreted antigen 1 [Babesia caballi]
MGNSSSIPYNPSTLMQCIDTVVRLTNGGKDVVQYMERKLASELIIPDDKKASVYIEDTRGKLSEFLKNLVLYYDNSFKDNVERFTSQEKDDYSVTLAVALCRIFPALLYLRYMVSIDVENGYGPRWSNDKCGWKNYNASQNLLRWLYDYIGTYSHLLPRGFWHYRLQDIPGATISEYIPVSYSYTARSLQKIQFGLFLICPDWYAENTANALLFIEEIVEHSRTGEFRKNNPYMENKDIVRVFETLYTRLPLITGSPQLSDGDSRSTLSALWNTPENMYHGTLKCTTEHAKKYMDWIANNLTYVIGSLEEMKADCDNWSTENFRTAVSNGPFSYGFVFKRSNWYSEIGKIKEHIGIVVDALNELHGILNPLHFMVYAGPIGTGAAIAGTLGYLHFTTPGGLGKFF